MNTKKYHVVLSPEGSSRLKGFCADMHINFFRTEYGNKRYCEVIVTPDQFEMVENFLSTLEEAN